MTAQNAGHDAVGDGETRATEQTTTGAGPASAPTGQDEALRARLARIRRKILVLSGKGGVGKSSVAACLAIDLARRGHRVGVLDIDIHGPSMPRLLGVDGERVTARGNTICPVAAPSGVALMSVGLLLAREGDAVIWRGPLKYSVIRQFLRDVDWGELDYLIVDSPPGTGDEPLSVAQLIGDADGALIVTTPQDLSTSDVRRSIGFARQLALPVLGVIENMSGFVCPECGARMDPFGSGGGRAMAEQLDCRFLGSVPLDPAMVAACDRGGLDAFIDERGPAATAFSAAVEAVLGAFEAGEPPTDARAPDAPAERARAPQSGHAPEPGPDTERPRGGPVVAVPVTGGLLSEHFGHCESFALYRTESPDGACGAGEFLEAPEHQPGLLPGWLSAHGVDVVIAAGMGGRAKELFEAEGIEVISGARKAPPDEIVRDYLAGTLETGRNACDH